MPATLQRLPALKSAPKPDIEQGNLIDQLLAEQKQLQTPVARFSEVHHKRKPDLADHYRSLIPLTKPGEGEQYAFEVSLDRCTGCKACVSACHSLNGLDDEEAWRDVGALLGGKDAPGWQQTVTTACHHCADPGCMNGCPVGAYEKEKDTGIVRHLDDQCIGCSYCILKCPYDVPKYSKKRGIVRKCDMCHQRLAEGEAPACVQACPTEAIRIVKVARDKTPEARKKASFADLFQPANHSIESAIPVSSITLPTTRYVGREVPASATAADVEALVPQHAHWPLVFMLMLTQAGAGLLMTSSGNTAVTLTATGIFFAGMGASVFHLGQPLKAWRFFLGLRTSWLSREILAFSMFVPIPVALAAFSLLPHFPQLPIPHFVADLLPLASRITSLSTIAVGLVAVFTSVMIYHDTKRSLWRFPLGAARFFGTVASFAALGNAIIHPSAISSAVFMAAVLLKMVPELRLLQLGEDEDERWSPDVHSARLQLGPLGPILRSRFALAFISLVVAFIQPWFALPILLLAELFERQIYFQSVQAPKMPGNFGPKRHH
ncbi:MAG: molybdopterin oxidoreductase [Verrucomicrobiaceae bacterium]|nr:MAG: molybdopterin oxidoreductase [Verrucomicrobiaceae bacterium]